MSNRIAVFNNGVIQQLSTPDVLYEKPENGFVAQFIGENNTFSGKIIAVDGGKSSVEIDGGWIVKALTVNVDNLDGRTRLSLRPERVMVNPAEGSMENVFDGRVEELIYLGDHIRTRVSVCGNKDFIVKIPNSQLHAVLKRGQNIRLGWSSDDCRALDAFS